MAHKTNKAEKKSYVKEKLKQIRKDSKKKLQEKRARLVVKNLSFKITEGDLRKHFEKYGEISEIQILKKPNGKLVGCGFIQFQSVQNAAKAIKETKDKPLLGRNIQCDFAVAKDKYTKITNSKTTKVDNNETNEDSNIYSESEGSSSKENANKEVDLVEVESSKSDVDESDSESGSEVNQIEETSRKEPKFKSNDVSEGRTVFVKNIPFEATQQDLRETMLQFGPVFYSLICIDKATEHSKGTGFVKFKNKEDAEKCLEAGTELTLLGNILDCHPAINKNEIVQKNQKDDKEKKTDSRNLYLTKEGVIIAGTKAALGVSASDMAKRLQLEQHKSQMLKKLNMFVSKYRLIIYNLPLSWNDSQLRALLKKHAGPKAIIKEAKIMRDFKKVDSKGIGQSKGFGFVTFTTHSHALNALRSLNNNPNIFSTNTRPIVAFSIENKSMVRAKEKRLELSRKKNPKCKDYDPSAGIKKEQGKEKIEIVDGEEFSGTAAKPGPIKVRSRYKLSVQAKVHHESLKLEKKKKKSTKKVVEVKQPKQKMNKKFKKNDDQFSKMVNDYKRKLLHIDTGEAKKGKWYQD